MERTIAGRLQRLELQSPSMTESSNRESETAIPDIVVGGTTFDCEDQMFIVQAMCIYGHTAEDVAPCFGLLKDGTLGRSVDQIKAAHYYFRYDKGLLSDRRLWERDDAKFKERVKINISEAREEQQKLRRMAVQEMLKTRWRQRHGQIRKNVDWMSMELWKEQQWYWRQLYIPCTFALLQVS